MLHSLRLHNFRCYPSLSWDIPSAGAILCGDNAQGKTSLLEAICFALSLHSPRSSRLERLAGHGQKEFGISVSSIHGTRRIDWKPRNLQLRVDGNIRRDYADYLRDASPVSWLGNRDISLVQDGAEPRRVYLDFLGTQWHPAYRTALIAYRKALRSRNALLKNPRRSRQLLHNYAQILAEHGAIIIKLREMLLERLQNYVSQSHQRIAGKREHIELHYKAYNPGNLEQAFAASIDQDERLGYTSCGPQRDDFILLINDKDASDFASEGQQRSLATALQLGQANLLQDETGLAPILLIDDIFGELDSQRRQALLEALPSDSQSIITTTQLNWLGGAAAPLPIFQVENLQLRS